MLAWPLVGRREELAAITAYAADPAVAGVVLVGDAGVGKTALTRAALARLAGAGWRTDWVIGTRAGAAIRFGAVVHLLPAHWGSQAQPYELVRAVAEQAAALGGRARLALAVDDAHLLDDGSAAVVEHLARRGLAFVVATVRTGNPVPDAIVSLWKDGHTHPVDLAPLPEAVIDELLDRSLAGPLDGLSRRRLHQAAARNPLALRELLHSGLSSGALTQVYGVWRWVGATGPAGRVATLVADRLRAIDASGQRVPRLVACGEPLPLPLLDRLASPAAVATAEEEGLVVVDGQVARMAHPLYGEAVRAALSAGRAREIFRELAAAARAEPLDDPIRTALWQVDGGQVTDAERVLTGAVHAVRRSDLVLAERLARAAREVAPGTRADWVLGEILEYRGRSAEAAEVLSADPPPAGDNLAQWAVARASTLYWGGGRIDDAFRVLAQASDAPDADLAESTRSWVLMFDGQCEEALAVATGILARPDASDQAVIWATAAGAAAAGFLGRHRQAFAIHERGLPVAEAHRGDQPWGVVELGWGYTFAQLAAGDLTAGWQVVEQGYRSAIEAHAPMMAGGWAIFRGLVVAAQGRVATAEVTLREAAGALTDNDTFRMLRPTLTGLANASALSGRAELARAWLAKADQHAGGWIRMFRPWLELARAWTLAASGELQAAVRTAREAADLARATNLPTIEALAHYDVVRLGGRTDEERLREIAASTDAPLPPVLVSAVAGFAAYDAELLAAAAARFESLGYLLHATEAMTGAAKAFHRAGRRASAQAHMARAAALRTRCEGARTARSGAGDLTEVLTPREREVALLAARRSTREVADLLGLSPHTVNNNLARVYTKLGVSGRAALRDLLGESADGTG